MVNQYENFTVAGDLSINLSDPIICTKNYFSDVRNIFALTNLVNNNTSFKNKNCTLLNVILTNRPIF